MNENIDSDLEFIETQIIRIKKRLRDRSLMMNLLRITTLFILIVMLIIICVSLYGKHYLDTHPDVQQQLVQTVSDSFGIPITVDELGVGWEWKGPKIVAKQLRFYPDAEQSEPVVVFDEASVVLDLPGYLRNWVLNVADVTLSGAEIQLAQSDTVWYLNGHPLSDLGELEMPLNVTDESDQADATDSAVLAASDFRLPLGKFAVENINFVYLNEAQEELWRFGSMLAFVENDNRNTRIKFEAADNPLYEKLEFTASSRNSDEILERDWQLLLDAEGVNAQQFVQDWKKLVRRLISDSSSVLSDPEAHIRLVNGQVDAKVWSEVISGKLNSMSGQVGFSDLHFERGLTQPVRIKTIPELSFNLDVSKQYRLLEQQLLPDPEETPDSDEPEGSQQLEIASDSHSDSVSMAENDLTPAEEQSPDENVADNQFATEQTTDNIPQTTSLIQEESLIRLSNWTVRSDAGLWPRSDINLKRISYRDDLDSFDLDALPEVKSIERDQSAVIETSVAHKDRQIYALTADYVYLGDIAPLLAVISSGAPGNNAKWRFMDWRHLDGKLQDVNFRVHNRLLDAPAAAASAELEQIELAKLKFSDLSIPQINNQPFISGLNGQIDMHNDQGALELEGADLRYEHLSVFRKEIVFDSLELSADIARAEGEWKLNTSRLALKNPDLEINGQAQIELTTQGPLVDASLTVEPLELDRVKAYYPVKIMSDGLVNWLENGLSGGRTSQAQLVLKGNLDEFPFRNQAGEFQVDVSIMDTNMRYASEWPELQLHQGDLIFRNEGLVINAQQIESAEIGTLPVKAVFSDLADSLLVVSMERQSLDMQNTSAWLKRTPIYSDLKPYFEDLVFSGDALVDLAVTIPLTETDDTSVKGRLSLNNNQLKVTAIDDVFEGVSGDIAFTEESVAAEGVRARLRDQAILADVIQSDDATRINVSGDADLASLLRSQYLSGQSQFNASIHVPNAKGGELGIDTIEVSSNLLGANINLPAPFAKEAEVIQPLNLRFNMAGTQEESFTLIGFSGSLGSTVLQGRLFKDSNNPDPEKELQLHSLAVIGDGRGEYLSLVDLSRPQLQILGQFGQLDTDEWFTFINDLEDSEGTSQIELGLVDISLDEMNLLGQALTNAEVRVLPNPNAWQIRLLNEDMNGNIRVPRPWSDTLPIEIDMDRVYFKAEDEDNDSDENPLADVDLTKIPNFVMDVSDLRYGAMDLGQFSGRIVQDGKGASLKEVKVTNPAFDLEASGGWYATDEGEQTLLSMQMQSRNFARSLKRLGFAPAATAGSATADIELDWQGNPLDDLLETVSGKISFKFRNGSLQEVDPGAGRFLALLSIAQLPSRLSLDFRDVFGKGLKYDVLSGDFLLSNGQAYTNNMLMRGPVADVGMIGRVGLATRDFEQAAVVRADLGSSLPIAGALAGGLGVGAAVLLFSEIFKKPIKDATQVFYQIEGDWGEPKIERINPSQLKEIPIAP